LTVTKVYLEIPDDESKEIGRPSSLFHFIKWNMFIQKLNSFIDWFRKMVYING